MLGRSSTGFTLQLTEVSHIDCGHKGGPQAAVYCPEPEGLIGRKVLLN